ncbi:hypothetical protein [Bacillus sp. REN10]|uniref:hypothetical protein n=1 Tax=Bacillus sp. REN10 TaxID=2782541 RepID=UPI00193B1877|nr:hypothetical protein [Bacillus sp. REN10]
MSSWKQAILNYWKTSRLKKFWDSSRVWKYILKRVSVVITICGFLFLGVLLKGPADVMVALSASAITLILAFDLFSLLLYLEKYLEGKEVSKSNKDTDKELYYWTGRAMISDKFYYDLFSTTNPQTSMSNLITLKEKIEKACSNDINKLYLLKNYIELKNANNVTAKFWTVFTAAFIGAITSLIPQIISDSNFISKVHTFVNGSENKSMIPKMTVFINYSTYGFIIVMVFLFLRQLLTKEKNRLRLISFAIDNCIMEIENKETDK